MKSNKSYFIGMVAVLAFLLLGVSSCKKEKVDEVPDFSQTFKNVAVTPITVTSPAATTYTAGSVSTPPTVAAAAAALTLGNTTPEL